MENTDDVTDADSKFSMVEEIEDSDEHCVM
jgi:hypothetical protein